MRRGDGAMGRFWHLSVGVVLALPLMLAACGGDAAPTNTAAPTAGTSPTSAPTIAAGSAARPTTAVGSPNVGTATGGTVAPTSAPATAAPATAASAGSAAAPTTAGGSGTTVAGTPAAGVATARGAAPAKRGGGGTLRVLAWQAPTLLNIHLSQGGNNSEAARVVSEPLAEISGAAATPDVPLLAEAIPSTANGLLAADGKRVTWRLRDGLKWSDGTAVTSEDFRATWQYVMKPENGATTVSAYRAIASVDTPDARTIVINFAQPTATWYLSGTTALLQKAQISTCASPKDCPINTAPVGTGPYKVKSLTPGDNVQFVINDNYREATAPFFDAVDWKGGGDAATAAKAIQTGQADWAWNLQVTPELLKQVTDAGQALDVTFGFGVEKIQVNFTDPIKEVDGEKSSLKAPHPFQTDPKVREAFSWLIDRDNIAKTLYGAAGKPTCNVLPSVPPQTNSTATKCGFDVAKANQILDAAGYAKGADGIRAKNGVPLKVVFTTTAGNPVRERTQQVIKAAFAQAGIGMDLKNVDAGVFFGAPDNPDAGARFERDLQLWTKGPLLPDAEIWFADYSTKAIAQKANGWKGTNYDRFSDPKFDAMLDQLRAEMNPEKRAQLQKEMNDYVVNTFADIPVIDRASVNGHRSDLINTNPTPWDWSTWNIAYWQIKK